MRFTFLIVLSFFLSFGTSIVNAEKAELLYKDAVYEQSIKTVEINPLIPVRNRTDVFPIGASRSYLLEFDDLRIDADYYFVYLIHCNADWSKSQFNPIEYLFEYNEFEILDYEFSIDTRTPYTHYKMRLPRVRIPGNYLMVVYRGNDINDLILSKRFMVYEEKIGVGAEIGISSGVKEREQNQQINFKVNYAVVDATIPTEEIKVIIRQNLRWDNAIIGIKPTFIRADLKEMEYFHFNLENNFQGGNEFRYFDIRTLNFRGENVAEVEVQKKTINTYLYLDKSRGEQVYSVPIREDLNGQFIIANVDDSPREITGEYTRVHFKLNVPEIRQDLYILGAMNSWEKNAGNRMRYNSTEERYEGSQLLKQGWYDYQYVVDGPDPLQFEGSYRQTRNQYEILIYYGRKGSRGDLLLGYLRVST